MLLSLVGRLSLSQRSKLDQLYTECPYLGGSLTIFSPPPQTFSFTFFHLLQVPGPEGGAGVPEDAAV